MLMARFRPASARIRSSFSDTLTVVKFFPCILQGAEGKEISVLGRGQTGTHMMHDSNLAGCANPLRFGNEVSIKVHFDFCAIEAEWLAFDRESVRTPFQSLAWVRNYLSSVSAKGAFSEPAFGLVYASDRLVALFPFELRVNRFSTSIGWLAGHMADYNAPIVDESFAEAIPHGLFQSVLSEIKAVRPDIDYANFVRTVRSHPALPELPAPPSGFSTEYDSHAVALEKEWGTFYRKLRSKDTRRRIRNKLVSLHKEGSLRFMRVRTAEERAAIAGQILDWKSEQLNRAGDGNPFAHQSELRRLIISAAAKGSLEIYCLRLNNKPIAGVVALLTKRVFHLWVTAYDPTESSKHSIGLQLIVKTLELAARSGFEFYDFLYGDESYKTDWCNIRATMQHHYVPLSRRGKFICKLLALRLSLKKQLIARPGAMQIIRGARRQLQGRRLFLPMAARRDSALVDLQGRAIFRPWRKAKSSL